MRHGLVEKVRALLPNLPVTRTVQGVALKLPWSHRLPDYARVFPTYGKNLVAVADALAELRDAPLRVLDIGANVGDSALQILQAADSRILCVEGDDYWVKWLRRNVSSEPRITIEPSLLTCDLSQAVAPARDHGTTQFRSTKVSSLDGVTAVQLRDRHPEFTDLDLIKVDTDGYDCRLAPALAAAWAASMPVIFLEFDPGMTLSVGQPDPWRLFTDLTGLGYISAMAWDNFGTPLGYGPLAECARLCDPLREPREKRTFDYADIAVAGVRDDHVLRALG